MAPTEISATVSRVDSPVLSIPLTHPESREEEVFSFSQRLDYIRAFGNHAMAFSTLQPGMNFFDIPGKGFIAYKRVWGADLALADPVCDEKDRKFLIGEFVKRPSSAGFVQASKAVADIVNREHGFYATQFGIESKIYLPEWDLKGKKKQVLRTAKNQAEKQGIVFRETAHESRYQQISNEWLRTRKVKHREIHFLIRPMNIGYQQETRKFFAYLGDELIGFIFFDPLYENHRIIGYIPNISRFRNQFRQGIFYALMLHAIETFKSEGLEWINMGLSPLAMDEENEPTESGLLKKCEWLLYKYANAMYNFKGLRFAKSRFNGEEHKVYCCCREYMPALHLLRLLKILNIF